MKKQYIKPFAELVDINLKESVMLGIQRGSYTTDELGTNQYSYDAQEFENEVIKSPSLWDE